MFKIKKRANYAEYGELCMGATFMLNGYPYMVTETIIFVQENLPRTVSAVNLFTGALTNIENDLKVEVVDFIAEVHSNDK